MQLVLLGFEGVCSLAAAAHAAFERPFRYPLALPVSRVVARLGRNRIRTAGSGGTIGGPGFQ